ncbi:MAG: adenylate/guanylate cyclase domain-containing protein [Gammaproteobacteria bacterium]|nr:adenylate/guanylate cyclase domain-containing protein [Gammaproteobacteria bacterium]MBU0787332.1 adenylate/guanylate cyclase domain-containing protein [Gammaproteobacteria bacterium]MBU0816072.1 adenylate/guanylate cyclase domain-containing protein [Gammaproteobacteria bacterium]MBU1787611.1 adenylate/guanylate cyclase domain-containing protein [Gammaproteobacteria bacterium]
MATSEHDELDRQVNTTLQGSALGLFLTELFQGSGQLALFLLLLEVVSEWSDIFGKPDVYVLLIAAIGQSAWLARRRRLDLALPWWSRLVGLLFYALAESLIEGRSFFFAPHHITFATLMLLFAWGSALETRNNQPALTLAGIALSRTAQALGPILFYIALDLRGQPWLEGISGFFHSAPHAFLMALAITQVGALISLALVARRQQTVIDQLLHQLKTLSRWGFGSRVVKDVLRANATQSASRVERAIGFIDIRGFTAWSETRQPEDVIKMLNRFYAAVLDACGEALIKSKMSGDEVLLVLPADGNALQVMQKALRAALAAVQPLQLSAGAGLWAGPVVEGFFGAQASQVHDVIGDTVNTAKRLCDHAGRGQLLAGPIDWLADERADRISLLVKGKQQPLTSAAYQLAAQPLSSPPDKS